MKPRCVADVVESGRTRSSSPYEVFMFIETFPDPAGARYRQLITVLPGLFGGAVTYQYPSEGEPEYVGRVRRCIACRPHLARSRGARDVRARQDAQPGARGDLRRGPSARSHAAARLLPQGASPRGPVGRTSVGADGPARAGWAEVRDRIVRDPQRGAGTCAGAARRAAREARLSRRTVRS